MKKSEHKVLIIKVGYSETLDPEISDITSYGDVLRTTVLLHLYKNDHVTWLVDAKAYPILKNNPYIDRVLIFDLTSVLQLKSEHFDTVINLEKVPGLCALADDIHAWRRYGFRFDVKTGEAEAYDGSHVVLEICKDFEKKHNRKATWREGLFEMVGAKWNKEEYILGYEPKTVENRKVGFNFHVGNKWPLKAWPLSKWKRLEEMLAGEGIGVSWQEGLNSMEEYFDWINSCKVLVTNDSFGLHVAMALKRRIVALYGPTNYRDNYLYDLGPCLYPKEVRCNVFACREESCLHFEDTCMEEISEESVFCEIRKIFNE